MSVVHLEAGEYAVSADRNSTYPLPGQRVVLNRPLWIDAFPLSCRHFVSFVCAGGYARVALWPEKARPLIDVEERMSILADNAWRPSERTTDAPPVITQPMLGLRWAECWAVARAYGARLPLEVEWRIAYTDRETSGWEPCAMEWTEEIFTRLPVAKGPRSLPWIAGSGADLVTTRGIGADGLPWRRAASITDAVANCMMRRVWDSAPSDDVVAGTQLFIGPEWAA